MGNIELELTNAQSKYKKSQLTVSRITHHLERLNQYYDEDDKAAGLVALRIAKAESLDAKNQLDELTALYNEQLKTHKNISIFERKEPSSPQNQRDHFSEALARVSPEQRLQLAK